MKCANCGHEVDEGVKYCPVCGNPIIHINDDGLEKVVVPEPEVKVDVPKENPKKKNNNEFFQKNGKEIAVLASILAVLFLFVCYTVIKPNFWSIYYKFANPVVAGQDDNDPHDVMFAEENGVLYNNLGVVNAEFKDKLSDCGYSSFYNMGYVVDEDGNIYIFQGHDLTTELLDHSLGYAVNPNGRFLYYLDDSSKLKFYDFITKKRIDYPSDGRVDQAVVSVVGEYVCVEKWVYDGDRFKQMVYVSDIEGNKVQDFIVPDDVDYYILYSVSNDGNTVFMQNPYGDTFFCLREGELKEIYSFAGKYVPYLSFNMNQILFNDVKGIHLYKAGDEDTVTICSGEYSIYPKENAHYFDGYVFQEDDFEGTVISSDSEHYYWLDNDMKLVPFAAADDICETSELVGNNNDGYRFVYSAKDGVHIATFKDGIAGDKVVLDKKYNVCKIESDVMLEHVWLSTSDQEVYHLMGESCGRIYDGSSQDAFLDMRYDYNTENIYFITSDHKLLGFDKDDNMRIKIRGAKEFDELSEDLVFADLEGKYHRLIFDKIVNIKGQG